MIHIQDITSKEIMHGCFGRFIHGERSSLAFWEIKKGSIFKEHAHLHEQITYVLEGEMEMVIGGQKYLFTPGTTHVINPYTPHSALALTDCKVIDAFSPPREDYRV